MSERTVRNICHDSGVKLTVEEKIYRSYIEILKEELVPALGCTEPIAIAYAAAKAAEVLKESNGEKVQIAEHKTEEKAGTADRNGAKSASQTALDNCNGHLDVYLQRQHHQKCKECDRAKFRRNARNRGSSPARPGWRR